jgi:UDP-N-acetylglucosamine:LPS N-acetylglucosamine transferase
MSGVRLLVLSAEIGEGHVSAARSLVRRLERLGEVERVELRTDLEVLGARLGGFLTRGFHAHLEQSRWTYELSYRMFFQRSLPRRAAQRVLGLLGGGGLRTVIGEFGADVVVAEFPVLSAALGELRAHGKLNVPVCSSISDPAGLYYWVHPGVDMHLLSWPEAKPEAERIAGPGRAVVVQAMVDERFHQAPPRAEARARLALPPEAEVITVSGGGWGMGEIAELVAIVLRRRPQATVVALAGRNQALRAALEQAQSVTERLRVMGFTDRMPELLAASDVLIHTTGGTTALEARVAGCRLINYGSGVAHVRAHAEALARRGLAEWARHPEELPGALQRSLARGRPAPPDLGGYPDPADVVVGLGRKTSRRGSDSANQLAAALSASAAGRAE